MTLAINNQNAPYATVTLNGDATLNLTGRSDVNLQSFTQTLGSNALHATLRVRDQDTIVSNGFGVAAIPVGVRNDFADLTYEDVRGIAARRGFSVTVLLQSDSLRPEDLDLVYVSEEIQNISATGSFSFYSSDTSGYNTAAETMSKKDRHNTGRAFWYFGAPGKAVDYQTFKFIDARTGSVDIPMAKSGFIITREVFKDPTDGKLKLRTTKDS